ncbi:MAG: hypothetical protein ACM3VT_13310 [Solirubrobacterales bacterium]
MWLRWFPWKFAVRRLARTHGFTDPILLLSRIQRLAQPSEVLVPIELLREGIVFHARGLINSRVIQQNLDWVWPYWIGRQFDPASDAFIPRAFSLTHINLAARNWTAVGVPDFDGLPIVDPRGLVTPFLDGWSLDAWVVAEDGGMLIPSRLAEVAQRLDLAEGLAVVTSSRSGSLELESRVDAVAEPGLACRIRLRARADRRAWLVVSARPCNPEGISFIHRVRLKETKNQWRINRWRRVYFDQTADLYAVSDYPHGDVLGRLFRAKQKRTLVCNVGMATAAVLFELRGGSREVAVHVPLEKGRSWPDPAAKSRSAEGLWTNELKNACRLRIPDERMQFLYDAALRTVVLHAPNDVYPGPFTYKRFWFRDAAFILHAMLCAGLISRALQVIERFFFRQTAGGYFRSQDGEWDANGEVLWILRRFCELTGQVAPSHWLRPIARAAHWIIRKRLPDDRATPHAGLLPAGFSAEHLGPNDYYYWDDFWGVAGLRAAGAMLSDVDQAEEVQRFRHEADRFMEAIDRSLERARARLRSPAMPASCYRRLDSGAVGSIVAGYPLELMDPRDERLLATADYLFDHCLVGGGFFQDMIHSGINMYLTMHIAQVLLRAGDMRFVDMVRALADLASPTGQWPEAIHPRTHAGCMGDGQHTWAAAEWIVMMRNCLIRDEPANGKLVIGSGVLPGWLDAGNSVSIGPAPTFWGPVDVGIEASAEAIQVHWSGRWNREPPQVEIRAPGFESVLVPADRGDVRLSRRAREEPGR